MSSVFDQLTGTHAIDIAQDTDNESTDTQHQLTDDTADQSQPAPEPSSPAVYTPRDIKHACQELIKYGLLEMASKPKLYQIAIDHQQQVNDILEPLDLRVRIDDIRGLAFLVLGEQINDEEEWSHPLVRRQRLNLEQSLLLAILRECYIAHELEAGVGSDNAVVSLAELLPRLRVYLGDLGSETAEDRRLRNLLEKLKAHGIVSEVDKYEQVTIRPIITHVANPENLKRLIHTLEQHAHGADSVSQE